MYKNFIKIMKKFKIILSINGALQPTEEASGVISHDVADKIILDVLVEIGESLGQTGFDQRSAHFVIDGDDGRI